MFSPLWKRLHPCAGKPLPVRVAFMRSVLNIFSSARNRKHPGVANGTSGIEARLRCILAGHSVARQRVRAKGGPMTGSSSVRIRNPEVVLQFPGHFEIPRCAIAHLRSGRLDSGMTAWAEHLSAL